MKHIMLCAAAMLVTMTANSSIAMERYTAAKVDIDLTVMSSTMVYAEVFNIMMDPEEYVGKTIKMRGNFEVYHDEETKRNVFACLIADAAACCTQGLEFVLAGDKHYPEDYPKADSDITVTGTFASYQDGEDSYFRLADAIVD